MIKYFKNDQSGKELKFIIDGKEYKITSKDFLNIVKE
jgi:hypothetical protein